MPKSIQQNTQISPHLRKDNGKSNWDKIKVLPVCKRKCSTRHETCWSAKNFRWIAQQTTVWALQSWNTERDFFSFLTLLWWEDFGLGAVNYLYWHSASPGGVKKCPACRCLFCVSHEGSFINDRVAGFGLWSAHFCIWRQMRLKRYTWGKAESMEKRRTLRTVEVIYDPSHFYCCHVTDSVLLIDYICYDVWG